MDDIHSFIETSYDSSHACLSLIYHSNHSVFKSKDIMTYFYGVYVSMYAYLCSYVCIVNISESTLAFFTDNTF